MKNLITFLFTISFLLACTPKPKATKAKEESSIVVDSITNQLKRTINFDWLVGKWKRLQEDDPNQTFEVWQKKSDGRFLGHGYVMQNQDTVWQEKMTLIKKDSSWTLQVKTPGNQDLVEFQLSEFDSTSFTVENYNHDFPKKIKYWINNNHLQAIVEGDSIKLEFLFEKLGTPE
tara:strand:- start:364 stop:885 length:522 start_codon:yes stop_codon:yes gene_type:complete